MFDLTGCEDVVLDVKNDLEDSDVQDDSKFQFRFPAPTFDGIDFSKVCSDIQNTNTSSRKRKQWTPTRTYEFRSRRDIDYSPQGARTPKKQKQ